MFIGLGDSTPQQIIDYLTRVTSEGCERVLFNQLSLEASTRSPQLSDDQKAAMALLVARKVAECRGTTIGVPSNGGGGGGGSTPPSSSTPDAGFFSSIGTVGIVAAVALGLLLLVKR